jgi:hypothetical protein
MATVTESREGTVNTGEDLSSRVREAFRSPIDHVLLKYQYDLRGSSMSRHDQKFYSHHSAGHSLVINPKGYWMHMRQGGLGIPQVTSGHGAAEINSCLKATHPDVQYLPADPLLRRAGSRPRFSQGVW